MRYGLHDTAVNRIACNQEGIELFFRDGVYFLNENGNETALSGACKMAIKIDKFDPRRTYEHISICQFRKSKVKRIEFVEFTKLVEKDAFQVDIDYYSFFGAAILLKGRCGKFEIEFTITDVDKVEYIFKK